VLSDDDAPFRRAPLCYRMTMFRFGGAVPHPERCVNSSLYMIDARSSDAFFRCVAAAVSASHSRGRRAKSGRVPQRQSRRVSAAGRSRGGRAGAGLRAPAP
jgi:hypothetical protein